MLSTNPPASSVQLLSRVRLFVTAWTAACQASLSITNSRSLLRLLSIESVMPSNHLILCHPLLFLPSIFLSIKPTSTAGQSGQSPGLVLLRKGSQDFRPQKQTFTSQSTLEQVGGVGGMTPRPTPRCFRDSVISRVASGSCRSLAVSRPLGDAARCVNIPAKHKHSNTTGGFHL